MYPDNGYNFVVRRRVICVDCGFLFVWLLVWTGVFCRTSIQRGNTLFIILLGFSGTVVPKIVGYDSSGEGT